jgi:hypothetical protein
MAWDSHRNIWFEVYAVERASRDDLVALGKALEAWLGRSRVVCRSRVWTGCWRGGTRPNGARSLR